VDGGALGVEPLEGEPNEPLDGVDPVEGVGEPLSPVELGEGGVILPPGIAELPVPLGP
jgi:hypothetical protein